MSPLTMTVEQEREYRACCTSGGTEVDPVFAELDATRASLAAAEEKLADANEQIRLDVLNENTLRQALADERKHADWLAKQYRECSVWPSTEEQHAGCECGWTWGYMEHGDFEQEEQHAPECPNAVHAARRKEEAR